MIRRETTRYIEVFVDAPLEVCAARDTKGMYAKAFAGQIPNFTGVNDPYEAPENPDLHIHTDHETADESAAKIVRWLEEQKLIPMI